MYIFHSQHCAISIQRGHDLVPVLFLPTNVQSVVSASDGISLHPRGDCELRYHPDQHQPVWCRNGWGREVARALYDCAFLAGLRTCCLILDGYLLDHVSLPHAVHPTAD